MTLQDRTIFITGSGGVLGSTYVRRMLAEGARVVATDLPGHRAEALQAAHEGNENFRFYELDVGEEDQVTEIFQRVMKDGWEPNVVLNNAAITGEMLMGAGKSFPDFADTTVADFERTLHTNLTGAFMVARQMDRDIVGRYPATLINVASMYALNGAHHPIYDGMPFKNFSAYGITKAGIHGLTVWLAGYWAPRKATVNTIAPGAVFNGHSEEFQRRVGELIMAGRMAQPDEIADAMLFLCSAQSGYVTGQLLNVDGGFSAW
ncbi:NAD(P)-dependent dehydrogenase (short-subunit alcohol dehydrogenase family) [Rhodobacter aestuarii]|uniref:NAD(P)-dependent dehydrogenase, short-chain alcohol dehydrogenase family n=1 Tax=Rhodobacter aestuarii TaxID=453582 RepID=A0A1N7Q9G1_9RHOB|nr:MULTISPECIES: SDR family oxidoreductase [Rhodobacter]PTV93780.1 NAD(P)-dependent dehydrogenase (short-subunit alcohol dehydrogenase family) [Rhodobacter aestuarii]SIT19488.1 NAD(P)-dependent dehydrogenase, short-chain alcohol dehydrogenase family [Rhodobacter aestuarii]SOC08965.1 NAD(P)-dependent dehydrogenase (short-subunit alcohol dehydrogenase family) [Rhodobacter sp. JA431]